MSEIVVVAHVRPAEGKVDEVVAAFTACIEKTHAEEGCLTYALHRDTADPNHLVHVERWRSQADLDAHMAQPYVADLFAVAGTPGMLTTPAELFFTAPLGIGQPAKARLGG